MSGSTSTATRASGLVEAVVFDYGGVMTTPVKVSIRSWLTADGVDPGSFSRTLKAWMSRTAPDGTPIHRLETGELGIREFEELLTAELTTVDGSPLQAEGVLARLFAGMRVDSAMPALVKELRALGLRVGLLSNSWGNTYPRAELEALFDDIVISGEVGLRKPDAAIYQLSLERLGVSAERAVFVDDAGPNLEGARRVGLGALLHTDSAGTRAALAALVPGLPAAVPASS